MEFRWDRFSFQVSDFWGYDDAPTVDSFHEYGRRVDPTTGRPLDVNGDPLLSTQSADAVLRLHPSNRQLFDVICSSTVGVATAALGGDNAPDDIKNRCLVDIANSQFPLDQLDPAPFPFPITPANALSVTLTGNSNGRLVAGALATGAPLPPGSLVELNKDSADGAGGGFFRNGGLGAYLTNEQEALLGCGPFYGTDCDADGVDLFNSEASVLLQAFPEFEVGGPVATRFVNGHSVTLPGARGPGDSLYSPLVDGCTSVADDPLCATSNGGAGARLLVDPKTGQRFRNELGAASFNFMVLLAALGAAAGNDPGCNVEEPFSCQFVRGVFGIAGARRPDIRAGGNGNFGRRDFSWAGGSEIQLRYLKRNVLGFATDFAHDGTGTNWSLEGTWINGQSFPIASEARGFGKRDTYNLTISVDRPTFITFLNQSRTFFFNGQVFLRYIDGYEGNGEFGVHGPFSALGTLSIFTGYFQDRLLPAVTWVHDVASSSGGVVAQLTYRFSQDFSTTIGVASFYGDPDERALALSPALLDQPGRRLQSKPPLRRPLRPRRARRTLPLAPLHILRRNGERGRSSSRTGCGVGGHTSARSVPRVHCQVTTRTVPFLLLPAVGEGVDGGHFAEFFGIDGVGDDVVGLATPARAAARHVEEHRGDRIEDRHRAALRPLGIVRKVAAPAVHQDADVEHQAIGTLRNEVERLARLPVDPQPHVADVVHHLPRATFEDDGPAHVPAIARDREPARSVVPIGTHREARHVCVERREHFALGQDAPLVCVGADREADEAAPQILGGGDREARRRLDRGGGPVLVRAEGNTAAPGVDARNQVPGRV